MKRTLVLIVVTLLVLGTIMLMPDNPDEAESQAVVTQRWAGVNRFITAAEVARNSYPEGAAEVYLGSHSSFADPMVAGQAQPPGPILLAGTVPLHRATCEAITDLQPLIITAIGGSAAIPASNLTTAQTCAEMSPSAQEARMVELVNQERSQRGLNTLPVYERLRDDSRAWAEHLARMETLAHDIRPPWCDCASWGENVVGPATDAEQAHQALMDSPGHRDNILGNWDTIGIGVVVYKNSIWVVQQFVKE